MQLMNEDVSLYDPMKKKYLTNEDVLNKFGVLPDKVTESSYYIEDSNLIVTPGKAGNVVDIEAIPVPLEEVILFF